MLSSYCYCFDNTMISLDLPRSNGNGTTFVPEAISTETLPTSRSLRGKFLGDASSDLGKDSAAEFGTNF